MIKSRQQKLSMCVAYESSFDTSFRYVLGHEAMRKMAVSNVLVSGMRGLGIEIGEFECALQPSKLRSAFGTADLNDKHVFLLMRTQVLRNQESHFRNMAQILSDRAKYLRAKFRSKNRD